MLKLIKNKLSDFKKIAERQVGLLKKAFAKIGQKKGGGRALIVFDVPYNRFDEIFKNCGFAVENSLCTASAYPLCVNLAPEGAVNLL